MVVNNLNYLNKEEYENFVYILKNRRGCSNKIKNITISKSYTNVEFINFMYEELKLERRFSIDEEERYDGLYDYFTDIAWKWSDEKIRAINLLVEDEEYLKPKMIHILKRLQEHLANEVLTIGSIFSFPMSFDIYIRKYDNERVLKKSIKNKEDGEKSVWNSENRPIGSFGGSKFINDNKKLPIGNYREYDVNPKNDTKRDGKRFIRNVDTEDVYFTSDHYNTFVKIKK